MILESNFEHTLEQLMQGSDIDFQGPAARLEIEQIIRNAMREGRAPPRAFIPVIRRLLGIPGWKEWLNYETLVSFVAARTEVIGIMATIEPAPGVDPAAEYLEGVASIYRDLAIRAART